jgi:hypothetical protein
MSAVLLSIVFGNIVIALFAARDRSARRGLQKAVLLMLVLNVGYALALRYAYWFLH